MKDESWLRLALLLIGKMWYNYITQNRLFFRKLEDKMRGEIKSSRIRINIVNGFAEEI